MRKHSHYYGMKMGAQMTKRAAIGVVAIGLLTGCSTTGFGGHSAANEQMSSALVSLAHVSDELGNYERAIDYYGRIIAQGNADLGIWERRGELLLKLGAVKNARAHYEAAIRARQESTDIYRGYGRALVRTNQPALALTYFDKAIELDPKSAKAMNGRGVALDMLGRHLDAQAQYTEAQSHDPDDLSAQNNLALSYTLAGNAHSAIAMLEDVYLSGQSTRQHRQNLALLYGLTGQVDKATALSHIDLQPELVGKNVAAYATLRQQYQVVDAEKEPEFGNVAAVSAALENDGASIAGVSTEANAVVAMAEEEKPKNVAVPMTDVALLPLSAEPIEARDPQTLQSAEPKTPTVMALQNNVAAIHPTLKVAGLFAEGVSIAVTEPGVRSVVRLPQSADKPFLPRTLADIELEAMNAELDAFGNPIRILEAAKADRKTAEKS